MAPRVVPQDVRTGSVARTMPTVAVAPRRSEPIAVIEVIVEIVRRTGVVVAPAPVAVRPVAVRALVEAYLVPAKAVVRAARCARGAMRTGPRAAS